MMGISCSRAISGMRMGWIGLGWDLCVGWLYEHRFAVLINDMWCDIYQIYWIYLRIYPIYFVCFGFEGVVDRGCHGQTLDRYVRHYSRLSHTTKISSSEHNHHHHHQNYSTLLQATKIPSSEQQIERWKTKTKTREFRFLRKNYRPSFMCFVYS